MHFVNLPNYLFEKEIIRASGVWSVNFFDFPYRSDTLENVFFKKIKTPPSQNSKPRQCKNVVNAVGFF